MMRYPEEFIQPFREELTRLGVEELRTVEAVDDAITNSSGTVMVVVNSICGCAAGKARPGVALALQHPIRPDRVATVFAGGDIEEQVDTQEWNEYLRKSQDSLRVLAEDTGGLAVVNQNDFDKALKRIDAESSDYYVLGYYSGNPDPTRRRRQLAIKVTRAKLTVTSQRTEYVLKPPPRPASAPRRKP